MTFAHTSLLGAVAGGTIFLGLPLGRAPRVAPALRVGLSMLAAGILAFIFMDVGAGALELLEARLDAFKDDGASLWPVIGLFALLAVGVLAGTGGIATLQRWRGRRPSLPPLAGAQPVARAEAGAAATAPEPGRAAAERQALATAMTIAVAIGIHNFAEGLAIGVSARAGEVALATVLIVGFALHNATEGLGIVGPLGGVRPSWRWLGLAGLVGGGPTLLGTMLGYQVHSDALELLFLAVAGGAILYVIGEIWAGVRRLGHAELGLYLLGVGFLAGIATDLVVAYGGA
ncbi:ZIP family metal transporter [Patulibacter defluvii]|uniref:ZIP family metal transporter n=1 Tax=Patulibacter defluvii TaxID=3095358 RepID=UPI002A74BEA2|nr:ZIP family metal transporter [Patulibacter sp. DM4]